MAVMALMMKVMPLVPFLSTMLMVGSGNAQLFLQGWKYIVAAYVCYLLSMLIEFVVVSVRCKTNIRSLWGTLKQSVTTVFISGNKQAALATLFRVSKSDLHIDGAFADMWGSLSSNMLSPSRTISLVLSVFFVADITGFRVDTAVILIMLLTVVQLSLASTETVAGVTVLLETLEMPTDTVAYSACST